MFRCPLASRREDRQWMLHIFECHGEQCYLTLREIVRGILSNGSMLFKGFHSSCALGSFGPQIRKTRDKKLK